MPTRFAALILLAASAALLPGTGEAATTGHATMAKSKHKWSCYDYAWQSQDMRDCLAKAQKPAMGK